MSFRDRPFNMDLRDKIDGATGLMPDSAKEITTRENLILVDSRDCIGVESLFAAQRASGFLGNRNEIIAMVTGMTGLGVSPIVVTVNSVGLLRNDDVVRVSGVYGNTAANNGWRIAAVSILTNTFALVGSTGNGNYTGGGTVFRPRDPSYPIVKERDNTISGNTMVIKLEKKLRVIRDFRIKYVSLPRDLIPITVYVQDLYLQVMNYPTAQAPITNLDIPIDPDCVIDWTSFLVLGNITRDNSLLGFFSTRLSVFRNYFEGIYAPFDSYTPPPLQLWNPPQGAYPLAPPPYPYQTVPYYRSDTIIFNGEPVFYQMAGYGLMDLVDWTYTAGGIITNYILTIMGRLFMIFLASPTNSYDVSQQFILLSTSVTDAFLSLAGFGDYQRFLPIPGVGMRYQPGTSDGADPTVADPDWPVPFPDFRGNVWGPYDAPGDRFQKLGLRTLFQDLYLNGDMVNIHGQPFIKNHVSIDCFYNDNTFGGNLFLMRLLHMSFENYITSTNPNILNAMRIIPNGFGASDFIVNQTTGAVDALRMFTSVSAGTGGQGPSRGGVAEGAWVDYAVTGGAARFGDPIATGPLSGDTVPQNANGSNPGDDPGAGDNIEYRKAWYDRGVDNGYFLRLVQAYRDWVVTEVLDSNIVIHVEESLRTNRAQATNANNMDCNMSIPVRLNLGTTTGTPEYIENSGALTINETFWTKRFLAPKLSIEKFIIRFTTYDGTPINIEKQLGEQRYNQTNRTFINVVDGLEPFGVIPRTPDFLSSFDPLDPRLINYSNRTISIILEVNTYEYDNVGLKSMVGSMLDNIRD